jgi:hypothetical protein
VNCSPVAPVARPIVVNSEAARMSVSAIMKTLQS